MMDKFFLLAFLFMLTINSYAGGAASSGSDNYFYLLAVLALALILGVPLLIRKVRRKKELSDGVQPENHRAG